MKTIGKKIKQVRRDKGLSQNELAEVLGVTGQAVSKWESDTSQPDIGLLPDLAAYFGVAIDDLFEYSKEKQYEKIENTIVTQRTISNWEFVQFERFLLNEIENNSENYDAINLIANLYEFYAADMEQKASYQAKRALELRPNSKNDMTIISKMNHGKMYDWNVANHRELIEYWYKILREEPKNKRAYFYLLDDLIDDGRLTEARQVLEESVKNNPDNLNEAYGIWIDEVENGFGSAKKDYEELAEKYSNDWRVLFNVANSFSHNEYYEEAIVYWQGAFDAMEAPRYTDFYDAMAQCYIRLNDKENAIATYRKMKQLLKDEWDVKFGKELDAIDEQILKLEES